MKTSNENLAPHTGSIASLADLTWPHPCGPVEPRFLHQWLHGSPLCCHSMLLRHQTHCTVFRLASCKVNRNV